MLLALPFRSPDRCGLMIAKFRRRNQIENEGTYFKDTRFNAVLCCRLATRIASSPFVAIQHIFSWILSLSRIKNEKMKEKGIIFVMIVEIRKEQN